MAEKRHWTQTPEGKVKMSEIQKKAWAAKRNKTLRKIAKQVVREAKQMPVEEPIQNGHVKTQSWMNFCPYCGQSMHGKWKR